MNWSQALDYCQTRFDDGDNDNDDNYDDVHDGDDDGSGDGGDYEDGNGDYDEQGFFCRFTTWPIVQGWVPGRGDLS